MPDQHTYPRQRALRKGRQSEPHARYFITFCVRSPTTRLDQEPVFAAFNSEILALDSDRAIEEASFTLMPDHAHLLFRLGETLDLSKTIARLRSKTTSQLRKQALDLHWQPSFHDHKLRPDDALHPILHYIYLNPYRSQLIPPDQTWPYTRFHPTHWTWFQPLLNQNCPYPEWLSP